MKRGRIIKSAFRSLGRNKLRTFLMMIGVVIGITAVTMVVSVGLGAEKRVMSRVEKFGLKSMMVFAGGGREMGRPSGEQVSTLRTADSEAMLREIPAIAGAAPFNRTPGKTVSYQGESKTATLFGVTSDWAAVWDWGAARGRFITPEDEQRMARVCVIGRTVQQELFGDADPIGEQVRVGNVLFEIVGVLEPKGTSPGGGDMDNRVKIPLSTFMRRVANVDHIAGIKVLLHDGRDMERTAETIRELLRERHALAPGEPDDFRIITPTEVTQFAEKVAGTFNIFLVLVAAVSLIAGGFVIANIMLISVSERRAEIGLRKAIGALGKDIRFQFILESVTVTLTGGIIGIALGFSGAVILRSATQIPVAVSWEGAALGVVFSTLVGLIAGIQPARRAAALQPIEALRG